MLKSITEFIYQVLDKDAEATGVSLDVSKLFNRVWRAELLHKLPGYGEKVKLVDALEKCLQSVIYWGN